MVSCKTLKLSLSLLTAASIAVACSVVDDPPNAGPPPVGDPNPNGKPPGEACATPDDCRTGVCVGALCQSSTNRDGVKNGDETDVDCGGAAGPGCALGKACATPQNCASGACTNFTCAGGGPGPDCGGPDKAIPRCADGKACGGGEDCVSGTCVAGKCAQPGPADGVKNGDETDVDCGGTHPTKCGDGKGCKVGVDCTSQVCNDATKTCAAPTFDDKILNGTETDVDCGGPAPGKRCTTGLTCKDHGDCESNGCAFDKKCAAGATCTSLEGGQTCGATDGLTKQKDCCERAQVGTATVDKYLITAGRMRAFLTRNNGKIRDWAATLPAAKWNQAWTPQLPNQIGGAVGDGVDANTQLGPFYGKRSCESGSYNGHTYWTPLAYGDAKEDFPQNVLDTKALNCVPWWLMSALCVFDGGHLLTESELRRAFTNNNTTAYPWGARGTYTTNAQNDYAVGLYSYSTPNPPADARRNGADFLDMAYHIAPPGRRPLGYSTTGVADLVGNLLEWVGDSERQFVWKGSFERHAQEADQIEAPIDNDPYMALRNGTTPWRWQDVVANASDPGNVNGYYGIGGRCGY